MRDGMWRPLAGVTALAALTVVPGVAAAQPVDPTIVTEAEGHWLALASFGLVTLMGALFLFRAGARVDRAVDATFAQPIVAIVYGGMAFAMVVFTSLYATYLLSQVGLVDTRFAYLVVVILVGGASALAGFGYAVVGTLLTDIQGARRPWQGLLLGATISALGWLALPFLWALLAWLGVAAIGIGGSTREWVHRDPTAAIDAA